MNRQSLIEFRQVTKTYAQGNTSYQALKGVDFSIMPGEFVAVMGPSGSGKSTVMNLIGCLDVITSGEYFFQGVPVSLLDRQQRARLRRQHVGFVFQGFNLLARTTALKNVELPLIYRGMGKRERQLQALEALDKVGLLPWAQHRSEELSGGQQQRVAIARALAMQPAILLADEPTGNLDSQRSMEIMELLYSLNREQNLSIMMVTHEADMAAYASRIMHFVDGRMDSDQPNQPVLTSHPAAENASCS